MYKSLIPNGLTSMNLVFGMCSIFATLAENFFMASVFILLALVADGFDGRAARYFGISSELGKEMDSLCDLVSFGAAPAFLAYVLCLREFSLFGSFVAIAFALCGMWRLARFNVSVSVVHGYFLGLAIPAGGCLVATSTMLFHALSFDVKELGWIYPVLMLVVAFLMVSTVHYPDFKGKGEKIHIVAKIIAALMFVMILFVGRDAIIYALLFDVFATYATFGVINSLLKKK